MSRSWISVCLCVHFMHSGFLKGAIKVKSRGNLGVIQGVTEGVIQGVIQEEIQGVV